MKDKITVTILRIDGTQETHTVPGQGVFQQIGRLIGAASTDGVNLRDGRVMLVDDLGYETETVQHERGIELRPVRARKPVNPEATKLYHAVCVPGTTHQIVGDVAIVRDEDFGDDDDTRPGTGGALISPPAESGVSPTDTPYRVRCRTHGDVYLTMAEYLRQLAAADARWICPMPGCGMLATWDDENYERRIS